MSRLWFAVACLAAGCARSPAVLHMSTTTSVENSGLLAAVLPAFEAEHGVDVRVVAVGSGRALAILERGDADMSITHDPDAERAVIARGVVGEYRKLMYNDFVIAGPASDPAAVRQATGAVDAMRRIATAGSAFASRADSSGTHARELSLWREAGRTLTGPSLLEVGQGMGATLRVASERQAYVLTDRATLLQLQPTLRLVILSEGDAVLLNTYAVMTRAGLTVDRRAHAEDLIIWLTDGAGRSAIERFQIRGQAGFIPWPPGRSRTGPADLPHDR